MADSSTPRLMFVIASLHAGGAERVVATLASAYASRGAWVGVTTLASAATDFYQLDPRVRRTALGLVAPSGSASKAVRQNIARVLGLRRALRDATRGNAAVTMVSFEDRTNVLASLAALGTGVRVVVSERTDPRAYRIPRIWGLLRRCAYLLADAIVVQTRTVAEWALTWLPAAKVHVIPNPVASSESVPVLPAHERDNTVVGVGRFTREKGFDILVQAFAMLAPRHPEWRLEILGDGPLRGEIAQLVASLGIADRVDLPGRVSTPQAHMARASIFALPSRLEGFPNALLEAMAQGCAVVATDCPSGPRHIIRDGDNGLLVAPDSAASLAESLERLIGNSDLRQRLGTNAIGVRDEYHLDRIVDLWTRVAQGNGGN